MFQCVAALSLLTVDPQRSIDTHLYIRLRRNSGMQYSHLLIIIYVLITFHISLYMNYQQHYTYSTKFDTYNFMHFKRAFYYRRIYYLKNI